MILLDTLIGLHILDFDHLKLFNFYLRYLFDIINDFKDIHIMI